MKISTRGLYAVDHLQPGEPTVWGGAVAYIAKTRAVPADLVVTLNGINLVLQKVNIGNGLTNQWAVDPAGLQPVLGRDSTLHLVASSASSKATRAPDMVCAPPVQVTTTPRGRIELCGIRWRHA